MKNPDKSKSFEVTTPETAERLPSEPFELHSLRPAFSSPDHALYVGYLRDELNKPSRPKKHRGHTQLPESKARNLALTGSYGSGKSSILSKIVDEFGDRVVSVSLSTFGSEEVNRPVVSADKDPLEVPPITNSIQKEIVKQVLYREKPWKVPGSRYKRIERFRHGRAIALAAIIASVVAIVALVTGWLSRVETFFSGAFWPILASYLGLFVLATVAGWAVQLLFHNRIRIERVTSGPASVSLTDKTESFFDRYLDELVYFFEVNEYDIVVFEDLDRFNDPYIFETLRELNTLLNNSKQIAPKTITFIYAIKDSIFEQLGKLSVNGVALPEDEVRRLAVTNRTKFFDLVIPVVPFISHRNARDLLTQELKKSGFAIERPLVDIVARYIVDMRLIKNLHNEYGIFRQKILAPGGVNELDAQRLFAIVVYKNLNMAEFERIKDGTSALDLLYADYRLLVNQQIAAESENIRQSQRRLRGLESVEARAEELGNALVEYLTRVVRQSGSELGNTTLSLSKAVSLADVRTVSFWTLWMDQPELRLEVGVRRLVTFPYQQQTAVVTQLVSLDDVRATLGDPLDLEAWRAADSAALRETIRNSTEQRDFLKRAPLKAILARPELMVDTASGVRSLAAAAGSYLGVGLALDLVHAGYIDRNFSLYVSLYYDDTIPAQARNYLLHAVDANVMDENAQIGSGHEIDAMLEEAGEGIFTERCAYNVQIFDHLLAQGDLRLRPTLRHLARNGTDEQTFLTAYFSNGTQLERLVAGLAREWGGLLLRIFGDGSLEDALRVRLIDVALAAISGPATCETSADLGRYIEANVHDLTSLVGGRPLESVELVRDMLDSASVRFDSIEPLSDELRPHVVNRSLYRLTRENLVSALGGQTNLSLDAIRLTNENVYWHAISNLEDYVGIVDGSESTTYSIDDVQKFTVILNQIADQDAVSVRAVLQRAVPATYHHLTPLDSRLWPIVAGAGRLQATAGNIRDYLEKRAAIDEELAVSLSRVSAIADMEAIEELERHDLAVAIANGAALTIEKRVQLIASLGLAAPLAVSDLQLGAEEAELPGQLLSASLLEDSAAAFDALAPAGWPAQRSYVVASTGFVGYILDIQFTPETFEKLSKDPTTPTAVMRALTLNLDSFHEVVTGGSLAALARFVVRSDMSVGASGLLRFARGHVRERDLVCLIDRESEALTIGEILAILAAMPERYRKLTATGRSTELPTSPEDLRLADLLVSARRVSTREANPHGPTFRVNLRRKLDGT